MIATAALLAWMQICAQEHGVDPYFARAVAIVESRPAGGGLAMRCGPLGKQGKYYGPFGISRIFLKRWNIADPYVNVWVGVRALRGRNRLKILRRYNASFNQAYYREICRTERQLKQEAQCR